MNISLYELIGMKNKNSVLKSVFITKQRTFEGYPLIEIEAYDNTFINNTTSHTKQDKTSCYIDRMIHKYFDRITSYMAINDDVLWVADYSTFERHHEYIIKK